MKEEKILGSATSPKVKITIGKWYLEIGKTIAIYHTIEEVIEGIRSLSLKNKTYGKNKARR